MTVIPDEVLEEFKERMKITSNSEDKNLQRMLVSSFNRITELCGDFDLERESSGKDLVFERTRFMYNDALEYFEDSFLSLIQSFAFEQLPEVEPDEKI
ncbi:hypothetical protein [Rossellomorea marisflavi]|uniref:hypothetical protein n=1 Tax=Rossellomorea marisflavi TaxID=189381 RepID=UPI003458BFCE